MKQHYQLIIIGSGPAGLTAAIYAARARLHTLVLEGDTPGGQLMGTTLVENWPGTKSIMGPQLMMDMRNQAQSCGACLQEETVSALDTRSTPFRITTSSSAYSADAVIIATGAIPKKLGCPGEDRYWGKGVSSCAVCDGAFYVDQPVVIVGGGDTAMEHASFMTKFTKDITIVHIKAELTASPAMQERVLHNPSINILYGSSVSAIKGQENCVTAVTVREQNTGLERDIPARAVFIAIGLLPQSDFVKDQIKRGASHHIITGPHTQTSVPGIFAAGDVVDCRYRQAIVSAGTGCMAALDAERYLHDIGAKSELNSF